MKGLTFKPVRAGQVIGRSGAKRNSCKRHIPHQRSPDRGDRVAAAPMGLIIGWGTYRTQGFRASHFTPAYALVAPGGALCGTVRVVKT